MDIIVLLFEWLVQINEIIIEIYFFVDMFWEMTQVLFI